jgi:hypothetical protein
VRPLNLERLGDLVLARLAVPSARPPTVTAVAKSLLGFVEGALSAGEWRRVLDETITLLRDGGWIDSDRLSLSELGQRRVQSVLELRGAPDVKDWKQLKTKYLPRLFLAHGAGKTAAPNCAVAVLAARLEVPVDAKSTPAKVVDAWLLRKLALEKLSLEELRNALLARELGIPKRRRSSATLGDGIATLADASNGKPETVLSALAARWLQERPPLAPLASATPPATESAPEATERGAADDADDGLVEPTATRRSGAEAAHSAQPRRKAPPPSDPFGHFVQRVRTTANGANVRRYGDDKVFIGSVWQALASDPELSGLGEREFKRLLVEAHRRGSLVLARADLVAAMNPEDVRASETTHLNATYHFIQRGQPA